MQQCYPTLPLLHQGIPVPTPQALLDTRTKVLNKLEYGLMAKVVPFDKELDVRLEEISREVSTGKREERVDGEGSVNRGRRDKRPFGGDVQDTASFVPKYTKLDFPKYDGSYDPLGWIHRCEHFFRHQNTPEEERVGLASFHLEGDAQLWFLKLERDHPSITWDAFVKQCNLRFGPPIRRNKLGELVKLKQTESVDDYQRKFEQLSARAGSLTVDQEIEIFLSGLQEYIAVEVELHQPRDLATPMSLAWLYERRSNSSSNKFASSQMKCTESVLSRSPFVKRLSPSEIADRRSKGLCFNCDERFQPGHRCKKLFWLEVMEDNDKEGQVEEHLNLEAAEISIHAITGTQSSQTMEINGTLDGNLLLILIDSGSTHSFLDSELVRRLNLQIEQREEMRVMVANGERVSCEGICYDMPLLMGNSSFLRIEEWRVKGRDTEEWMRPRQLPDDLQERVRKFVQYKWLTTRGVDE
ncbi:Retrotransposon gag protein [Corchorus olitorius]|uniref:Retrotransposon gag protein n=1 Tax=Corchorus olitorius TaxID=93759 RepID=A0A1R3GT79_9ROSI|nr:Retrotransposon gag protein [Corchorus olitorius]